MKPRIPGLLQRDPPVDWAQLVREMGRSGVGVGLNVEVTWPA